jgi:nicotinamidase-related amidase
MNFPEISNTALILVDVQGKLIGAMAEGEAVCERIKIMLQAANILNLDVIVTEQYPRGLGPTVQMLAELYPAKTPVIEKTTFSCLAETQFNKVIQAKPYKTLVLMGIEAHVCVLQTALDALNKGYEVLILADTVTSRRSENCQLALTQLQNAGAVVLPAESLLFMLMRDAKHPAFREVSKLIR